MMTLRSISSFTAVLLVNAGRNVQGLLTYPILIREDVPCELNTEPPGRHQET